MSSSFSKSKDYQEVLYDWNNTNYDYPKDKHISQLFEEQVSKIPDSVALSFEEQNLSYQELNERANKLGFYLQKIGLRFGDRVGIFIERGLELIITIIGITKLGCIYVPLDSKYPRNRLSFFLRNAEPTCVIVSKKIKLELPWVIDEIQILEESIKKKIKLLYLPEIDNFIFNINFDNLTLNSKPDGFYLIHTSGSTGNPKGLIGVNKGTINRLFWSWVVFPFQKNEICVQKTSLNFSDHVAEIFSPLLQGVTLVMFSSNVVDEISLIGMLDEIWKYQISRIVLVPSLLDAILQQKKVSLLKLKTLKYIFSSGEVLSTALAKKCLKLIPQVQLVNLYGSSEVSADVTYYCVDRTQLPKTFSTPIGKPIFNTSVYVLTKKLDPVKVGEKGDIYVGGDNLVLGYLNDDNLTKLKFFKNPFSTRGDSSCLYNTGDVGRWLENGCLEYLGRSDFQVNIKGYRIEPEEVSSILESYKDIKQAVVLPKGYKSSEYLVAYYIPQKHLNKHQLLNLKERVISYLKTQIPIYMLPQYYVMLSSIPLTVVGKVDRAKLLNTDISQELNYTPPSSDFEKKLVNIWAKVLKISPLKIGINDYFFQLGGDSLKAMKIAATIKQEKLVNSILPTDIIKYGTISNFIKSCVEDSQIIYNSNEIYEF